MHLKSCSDVNAGDVVIAVAKSLSVFVELVGGGCERQRQLQAVTHGKAQTKVLLHVLQGLVSREPALDNCCTPNERR